MESQFLDCINKIRAEHDKEPFIIDSRLQLASQKHSDWQFEHNKMSHDEGWGGKDFAERIAAEGFEATSCAENVAWGSDNIEDTMNQWMTSRGHRANILGNYDFIGLSRAGLYWTLVLANL